MSARPSSQAVAVLLLARGPERDQLAAALARDPGLHVTSEASAADVVLAEWALLADLPPDTLGHAAVVALACDEEAALEAVDAGANAVVLAGTAPDELRLALCAAARGLGVVPAAVLERLTGREVERSQAPMPALTAREREVLAALADGVSNKVIARRLGISFHTAKFHVAALLEKLDAESRTEAVAKAARLGLVML